MKIIFVTGNKGKLLEASELLGPLGHNVAQFTHNGIIPEFTEPQSEGIEEVAISKMEQALGMMPGEIDSDSAVIVEDAGLFIGSLGGFPGPYSSYVEDKLGLHGILRLMEGETNRNAEYRAVVAFHHNGTTSIFRGVCEGVIGLEKRGEGGFGYDPIFIPRSSNGLSCAEMTASEKSSISHRGEALKKLLEFLSLPST